MSSKIASTHFLLVLLTFALQSGSSQAEEAKQFKDCPSDTLEDLPECLPPGTFYLNDDSNQTCKLTVDESTGKDCPSLITAPSHGSVNWVVNPNGNGTGHDTTPPPDSLSARKGGWSNEKLIKDCLTEDSTTLITSGHNQESGCYSFSVPVCEDARHVLNLWIAGGTSDEDKYKECYHIQVNGKRLPKIVFSNMIKRKACKRTEILANLKVEKGQTEAMNGNKKLFIPISGGVMSVDVCLGGCLLAPHEPHAQVITMYMEKRGGTKLKPCGKKGPEGLTTQQTGSSTTPQTISSTTPQINITTTQKTQTTQMTSDNLCKSYNGPIPSLCWAHGCQYLGGKCTAAKMSCEAKAYPKCLCSHAFCDFWGAKDKECADNPPIFDKKLTCRRANTHYVYHPKIHCFNEKDSGDCTATPIHAVNLNGESMKDQRGITYTADKDSGFKDPHSSRRSLKECEKISGVGDDKAIGDLYATAVVGNFLKESWGKCITYPVPLCQAGEYMLTIKMTEGYYKKANEKCTEVRLNNVPIMLDLDPFALSGNKQCGPADVTLMFLAEGGNDSDLTLHLKGHDEPIKVTGGQMELQFCYGYGCYNDNNYMASAFSLERLGSGTKECKLK